MCPAYSRNSEAQVAGAKGWGCGEADAAVGHFNFFSFYLEWNREALQRNDTIQLMFSKDHFTTG